MPNIVTLKNEDVKIIEDLLIYNYIIQGQILQLSIIHYALKSLCRCRQADKELSTLRRRFALAAKLELQFGRRRGLAFPCPG